MKTALYIARAGLPIDAPGIRIEQIGNLLEQLEYRVHYLAETRIDERIQNSGYSIVNPQPTTAWLDPDELHYQIGQKVYSYLPAFSGKKLDTARELLEIVFAGRAFRRVVKYCEKEQPSLIILYNDVYGLTKRLIPYCKKHRIDLIGDVTEWYAYNNTTIGEWLVSRLTNLRIRKLDRYLDAVLAISPFFSDYYRDLGVRQVWIPPLMELDDNLSIQKYDHPETPGAVNLVYAGSPGSKDILLPVLSALQIINRPEIRIRIDLVGLDEDALRKIGFKGDLLRAGIFAHGRQSHEETLRIVRKSDFGVLFRYKKRYAKAGFSTKFAECMSNGVAMICNQVGGTDRLIRSFKNGILLKEASEAAVLDLLWQLAVLPQQRILQMRTEAYQDARIYFDIKQYHGGIRRILETLTR